MDVSEYMPMFLAEAREHLQELNLAVVRIEETPEDQETVNEIFRIAHSMKGMSATMGFERMAALTHQMEDVFELLRQRSGGLPRDAINVLLECLDALEAAVEKIDETGQEDLDPATLIEALKGLVRERTVEQVVHRVGGSAPLPPPEVVAERAGGRRIVRVEVQLTEDCAMPSVRAYMVLNALGEQGTVLSSAPAIDKVDAFEGREIEAWVAAEAPDEEIDAAARKVADVADATLTEVSDDTLAAAADEQEAAATPVQKAEGGSGGRGSNTNHKTNTTSVRVDAARLDQLMHFMGELVVHRTHVESLAAQAEVPGLSQAMADLARASQSLQAMVMQVRMIPVEAVFLRFPRLIRDLSDKLGKQVELKLVGQDTELDRTVVDALGDPLVHLVRNGLDHGLESPEEREAAGKPPVGTLEISAAHAGGNVVISVRDDGRGIDPAKVAAKAVQRGLITAEQAESIDQARAAELLFAPGFSTAETTSDISGRGVGMDAVRTDHPRARRRRELRLADGQGHDGADPPAPDPGDHGRAAYRGRRRAVRGAARARPAHRAPGRPRGPLGRRQQDAGDARRRLPAAGRRRGARTPGRGGRRACRHRHLRRAHDGACRHQAGGPARAGHPPASARCLRPGRSVGRSRAVQWRHRAHRRLRCPQPRDRSRRGLMEGPHTMTPQYTDMQLDALRELANIGSGNAGTSLSAMLGHPVDISVPAASALPLADAVEAAGDPESLATGVVLPIFGDINATVLLLFPPDDEETLCNLLGVPPHTEDGRGALGEIGNILGCSYINSLAGMTGLAIEPHPPETVADMVGAIMATVLATQADQANLGAGDGLAADRRGPGV